ncbi:MAG: ATP synthase F1 subunit delta [Oligoflexia bacterium]|nr:ATP synthase F1 subunit delta [Oligoflexia bacterium]
MSVATTYAKALYEALADGKSPAEVATLCEKVEGEFDTLLNAVNSSKEAQVALFSPITNSKEKIALVTELTRKISAHPLMTNFLVLLANKGRLNLVQGIRDEFSAVRLRAEGGVPGRLVSAETMSESDIEGLAKAFSQKMGRRVAFRVATDPSLLAGVKVTVNGVTYDGTLRSQLQRLRDKFLAGVTNG